LFHDFGKDPCLKLVRVPPLQVILNPVLGALRAGLRGVLRQHVGADRYGRHLLWLGGTLEHRPREAIPPKVIAVSELPPLIIVVLVQSDQLILGEYLRTLGLSFALQPLLLPLELLLL
jgi:hypothetical protein